MGHPQRRAPVLSDTRAEEARRWLERQVGFTEACGRIQTEADSLHISPLSSTAVHHAIATYHAETGRRPQFSRTPTPPPPPEEQEPLL